MKFNMIANELMENTYSVSVVMCTEDSNLPRDDRRRMNFDFSLNLLKHVVRNLELYEYQEVEINNKPVTIYEAVKALEKELNLVLVPVEA